mmetsp:Transcript_747/g.2888  ORF Transcript_747/g.2888 Transcript_747/m.2888 type:complete len:211 (+) Transcript_747:1054-1686(+)
MPWRPRSLPSARPFPASPPAMEASMSLTSLVYLAIHVVSIQSLSRHTQAPWKPHDPRSPIAYLSPVLSRDKYVDCGTCLRSAPGSLEESQEVRFSIKGAPCLTAKTPALGLGWSLTVAQSPAAKTSGWLTLLRVSSTKTKPLASVARPDSASQGAGLALVHHRQWSKGSSLVHPSAFSKRRDPRDTPSTLAPSTSRMPLLRRVSLTALLP